MGQELLRVPLAELLPTSYCSNVVISRHGSAASSGEKYTLKNRFQNRVYVFKASGVRSDEKIYNEWLIQKSCL